MKILLLTLLTVFSFTSLCVAQGPCHVYKRDSDGLVKVACADQFGNYVRSSDESYVRLYDSLSPHEVIEVAEVPHGNRSIDIVNGQLVEVKVTAQEYEASKTKRNKAQDYLKVTPSTENSIPALRERVGKIEKFLFGDDPQQMN